jgi:hypothetical protein
MFAAGIGGIAASPDTAMKDTAKESVHPGHAAGEHAPNWLRITEGVVVGKDRDALARKVAATAAAVPEGVGGQR